MSPSTACIVQGNIRNGCDQVIRALTGKVDLLILSTWRAEQDRLPPGDYELILNDPPAHPGLVHRNLQRVSVAAGLKLARERGCQFILKWRTDLLPTRLDIPALIQMTRTRPPAGLPGRLVMTGFRNLTVWPDWLSSVPDLFGFGPLEAMERFWGLEGFDSSLPVNVPAAMLADDDFEWPEPGRLLYRGVDVTDDYDPHVEFYAVFKDRLQRHLGHALTHDRIVRDFFHLIEHESLQICWFRAGDKLAFRNMRPARRMPWWTARQWQQGVTPDPLDFWTRRQLKATGWRCLIDALHTWRDLANQRCFYHRFLKEMRR